jgi:hypothetical protein
MEKAPSKAPVPNHVHGRVTDINMRLKDVRNKLERILDRIRSPEEAADGEGRSIDIRPSVQSKLSDSAMFLDNIESLVEELENSIGTAQEDVPQKAQVGRAIG